MARKTKKFHRRKSDKLIRTIRARRKAAQQPQPAATLNSPAMLPTVDLR